MTYYFVSTIDSDIFGIPFHISSWNGYSCDVIFVHSVMGMVIWLCKRRVTSSGKP